MEAANEEHCRRTTTEFAALIHPTWRKNEADYWAMRDQLLERYRNQWIGFADGAVIVSGASPVEVAHAAESRAAHPFVTCVGHENEPCRIRRATFACDPSYSSEQTRGSFFGMLM
jgi:hypothetical protein